MTWAESYLAARACIVLMLDIQAAIVPISEDANRLVSRGANPELAVEIALTLAETERLVALTERANLMGCES